MPSKYDPSSRVPSRGHYRDKNGTVGPRRSAETPELRTEGRRRYGTGFRGIFDIPITLTARVRAQRAEATA
jgi:hypothetical protein